MTEVNAHNKTVSFRRFIVCFYFGFVQFLTQIARISTKTKHDFSTLTHIHTQTCTNLINILNLRFNTFYVQKKKTKPNQLLYCLNHKEGSIWCFWNQWKMKRLSFYFFFVLFVFVFWKIINALRTLLQLLLLVVIRLLLSYYTIDDAAFLWKLFTFLWHI